MTTPESGALIIAGMHRSGTSLLASMFAETGISVGDSLLEADRGNPRGYFEDTDFLQLHQRMFAAASARGFGGWPDWGWLEHGALDPAALASFRDHAAALVAARRRRGRRWGWKDPRTTLVLPFWSALIPEARYVFVFRAPWEVEDSIRRRGIEAFAARPDYALKIWRHYNEALLRFYASHRRRCSVISLDTLEHDPAAGLGRVLRRLGITPPTDALSRVATRWATGLLQSRPLEGEEFRRITRTHAPVWRTWEALHALEAEEHGESRAASRTVTALDTIVPRAAAHAPARVSVVVTGRDAGPEMVESLHSLASVEEAAPEGLVLDAGSAQSLTLALLARMRAQGWIVVPTQAGDGDAANAAVSAAGSDFVLCVRAGQEVRGSGVSAALSALEADERLDIVCGGETGREGDAPPSPWGVALPALAAGAVVRRAAWLKAGGHHARLHGDAAVLDLVLRLLAGGSRMAVVPEPLVGPAEDAEVEADAPRLAAQVIEAHAQAPERKTVASVAVRLWLDGSQRRHAHRLLRAATASMEEYRRRTASSALFAKRPGPLRTSSRFDRPVFILGAPRSGSTLLFETLAQAPGVFTVGAESHHIIEAIRELAPAARGFRSNRLAAADATPDIVARLHAGFWARLHDRDGTPAGGARTVRMLEKTPKNSLRVPFLKAAFPDARFVYLYRDPAASIASIMEGWESGRLVTYRDLPGWQGLPWSMLLIPGWPELNGKSLAEIAAAQWEAANRHVLDELAEIPEDQWCAMGYDELVADAGAVVARLDRFADFARDRPVESLALSSSTRSRPAPDKWRSQEARIAPLLPGLAPTAQRALAVLERRR